MENYEWLLTEDLYVTCLTPSSEDARILVTDAGRRYAVVLSYGPDNEEDPTFLFNGEFVDVGDALGQLLGLVDEAYEMDTRSEHFLPAPEGEYFRHQQY